MTYTILHNPKCSKSRQTLELLQGKTRDIKIIEYLENTPSVDDLKQILMKLDLEAKDIVRMKEEEAKALNINWENQDEVLASVVNAPKILERPIVFNDTTAIIGRPPENLNKLF